MPLPRPNTFARLFKQWRRLHPYNAIQAMRLTSTRGAAAEALAEAVRPLGVDVPPEPVDDLDAHLSAELNRPFGDGAPLRAFACGDWLGLTYDHHLADSVGVRLLMRRWAAGIAGLPLPAFAFTPSVKDPLPTVGAAREMWRSQRRMKRLRRLVPTADPSAAYLHRELPAGLCGGLRGACRAAGVKVNDVFVAAAARATIGHLIEPMARRPDVGVGTIVDDRGRLPEVTRDGFGLHLAFRNTFFEPDDLASIAAATRVAHEQAEAARRPAARRAAALSTRTGVLAGRLLSPATLREFYRKRVPFVAGVSNVNLDAGPVGSLHPDPLLAYRRVSPLGPTMAVVFTPTTLGGELTLGVTYRRALLDAAAADEAAAGFVADLTGFAAGR